MAEINVTVYDDHRYDFVYEIEEFYGYKFSNLGRTQVDRAIEHALAPKVGEHAFFKNKFCPICLEEDAK